MKKRIAALVLACMLALPLGNVTAYGTETSVPLSAVQTETGDTASTGSEGVETEEENSGEGISVPSSNSVTDNATVTGENDENTSETENDAAANSKAEDQTGEEKYKEHLALPGFSYHDGKLWYKDAELDENGCYAFVDNRGVTLKFDSLDPEFPETFAAIQKGKATAESDEISVSNSALGAKAGDIYAGLNGAAYMHPAGADGKDVIHGIDVSYSQGYINWAGMKQSGVQFAIIRSGARGYGAEGSFINDAYFTTNMANAAAQGMKIGVYFFSQAVTVAEAQQEADVCYQQIMSSGYRGSVTLPVYIDYEYAEPGGSLGGRMYNAHLTPAMHTAICNAFCERMNAYGFQAGIYANKDMLTSDMVLASIPTNYSIWMANWQNVTSYAGRLDCWQYHVSTALGSWVSNATKTVDLDFGYWAGTTLSATASANPATLTLDPDSTGTDYVETTLTGTTNKSGAAFSWKITMSDGAAATGCYTQTTPVTNGLKNTSTLRFTKPGTYKVTLTVTREIETASAVAQITVKAKLQEGWFSAQSDSFTYDGKEHVIKDLIKTTALAPNGTDYFTAYYEKAAVTKLTDVLRDSNGEVIPYKVTISGTGAISGTITREVYAYPRNIGGGDCVITMPELQEYVPTLNALQLKVVDNGIYTQEKDGTKTPKTLECEQDYVVEETDTEALGSVYVTIDGIGNYTGSLRSSTTVQLETAYLSDGMISAIPDQFFTGKPVMPAAQVTQAGAALTEGKDYTVSYENNVNVGKATALYTGIGHYTGTATAVFQIKAKPLTEDMLVEIPDQIYTGTAIRLDTASVPVLKNTETGQFLTQTTNNKDGDYKIAYAGNTNIGTATVTLTGLNNYSGTVKGRFAIKKEDIGGADVTILLANAENYEAVYTGKEIKPAVKVLRNGKQVAATNYTVAYADNKNVGRASVILTGKGSFEGTAEVTFEITKKALSKDGKAGSGISFGTIAAKTYSPADPDGMRPIPVVKYGGGALSEGTDYILTYDKIETNEKGAVIYDASRQMVVETEGLEAITEVGSYRAVLTALDGNFEGVYAYPSVFKVNAAKIAAKNVTMKDNALRAGDTEPGITAMLDGSALLEGRDYRITYVLGRTESDTPSAPGRYTVRVDGIGNYQGRVSQTLTVYDSSQKVFGTADFDVELPTDFDYSFDNTAKKPAVTVTEKSTGSVLTLNKDYTVAYADNKNAGNATVKVTGKGIYKGTITETFVITPCEDASITSEISKLSFGVNKEGFTFNGKVQKALPVVKLMTTDARTGKPKAAATLKMGTDYTAEYENDASRNAGEYEITLHLKGNYTGTGTVSYKITPYEVSRLTVSIPAQYYDGSEKQPVLSDMVMKCGAVALTEEDKEGLEITGYANNKAVGTRAQVTIEANDSGNFTNKRTERSGVSDLPKMQYFSITRRALTDKNLVFTVGGASVSAKNVSDYETEYEEVLSSGKRVAVAKEPEVTIIDSEGNALQQGVDFKVSYSGNKNVGRNAAVTVSGLGGYTGSRRITFAIMGKPLEDFVSVKLYKTAAGAKKGDVSDLVGEDSYVYTGSKYSPVPVVEYQDPVIGATALVSGTDYTIQYADNINAGTATVRLVGKGRYQGVVENTFAIAPVTEAWLRQNKKTVTVSAIPTQYYTGKVVIPNVTVTAGGRKLTKGKDYTLDVTNSVILNENQTALLKVNGIGNYKGMLAKKEFAIVLQKTAAPTLSSTEKESGWVQISWKAVPGATGYMVEVDSNGTFKDSTSVDVSVGTDNLVISGDTWSYKIRANKNTTKYIRLTSLAKVQKDSNGTVRVVRMESEPSPSKSIKVK